MKGCGAWGNSRRAAARSPPCSSDPAFKWDIMAAALTLLALLIEAMAGYPDRLVRSIGHPVIWMGSLIAALERRWNRETAAPALRRTLGAVAIVLLVGIVGVAAFIIERGLLILPFGLLGVGILGSTLIAQRSLHQHVARVADALDNAGLASGREAVSHIVSRDTNALDEAGVVRAAIESLAENFSDGVVAPVLWMIIAGLPGAAIYKAINTADSMIGHRTVRFQAFGWRLHASMTCSTCRRRGSRLCSSSRRRRQRQGLRHLPPGTRCGATPVTTARRTRATRTRQWQERSVSPSQVRVFMPASMSTTLSWETEDMPQKPTTFEQRSDFTVVPTRS